MIVGWIVAALAWFVYSYGFVDFNLTLTNNPTILGWIGTLQHLVFFDRMESQKVYILLLVATWILYLITLWRAKSIGYLRYGAIALILATSYPMLTHDVFNYLFHARILITYQENPHVVAPQVFASDHWIRFMHWVHLPSAYGPVFTAVMVIPYVIGMSKLTLSLYLYKLLAWASYLLAIYLIGEIAKRSKTLDPIKAQLLLGLNPIILTEWLVNAHNEVLMVTLMLVAWYLIGQKKIIGGVATLALATGLKYAAILIAPALLVWKLLGERVALVVATLCLFAVPFGYHFASQYQIWYITWMLPFAILSGKKSLIGMALGYSLGGMLIYQPYIATGFWSLTPSAKMGYLLIPAAVGMLLSQLYRLRQK